MKSRTPARSAASALRLGQRTERDDRQARMRGADRGDGNARRVAACGEVDEHERRVEAGDALREHAGLERCGFDRTGRHERVGEPAHVCFLLRCANEVVRHGGFT
jgi:hypothetical protein